MKKLIIPSAIALVPVFAFAQDLSNVRRLLESIGDLVNLALPIVVGIALLGFFWGLAQFIFAQGDIEKKTDAKKTMIWGIVALFVMVSVWGLVRFIGSAVGVDQEWKLRAPAVDLDDVFKEEGRAA